MRIAVVTPHWNTPLAWFDQCRRSVLRQTIPCTHFLVNDGDDPRLSEDCGRVQVIQLPQPHGDVGNAARAMGSISAICQGYDAIAYLDADNWYEPRHLESLAALHRQTGAALCTSRRNLYHVNGTLLGPCPEVDGEEFVDTSCLFITRAAFDIVSCWYAMPKEWTHGGDRFVWEQVKALGLSRVHSGLATVAYRTNSRVHYEHFQVAPPAGAKDKTIIRVEKTEAVPKAKEGGGAQAR